MRQKNMMCQICSRLWVLLSSDRYKSWSAQPLKLFILHHAWEEDIKSWTYLGLCRSLSVLWGYFYIHWGQWQGSRCLLWVHRQECWTAPRNREEVLLEADSKYRAQGQAGTHLLQLQLLCACKQYSWGTEVLGIQISLGLSKPSSQWYRGTQLTAFWD